MVQRNLGRRVLTLSALAGALLSDVGSATAHPHVWVQSQTSVLYQDSKIIGIRHKWTFDPFYTEMAIAGLDRNGDGDYSREELAELAKVNIDGLKEFGFFTNPKLGSQDLAVGEPTDYHLEYAASDAFPDTPAPSISTGGLPQFGQPSGGKTPDASPPAPLKALSLVFTLPLQQPVLAEARDFSFTVSDPSLFIAFDFAKTDPFTLGSGAPAGCRAELAHEKPDQDVQKLGQAFAAQLGGVPGGAALMTAIKVVCESKS